MARAQAQPRASDVWYRSERLVVRRLQRSDIGAEYVSWFKDPAVREFIKFAKEAPALAALQAYWQEKDADPRVDFLGLFDAKSARHVGNMKFEAGPGANEVHVGFLVGAPSERRRGLLRESLAACVAQLRSRRNSPKVYLTVDPANTEAIGAFVKLGFRHTGLVANSDLRMDYPSG
jgi:RimJ/RimL family protein N-acetyltransferase